MEHVVLADVQPVKRNSEKPLSALSAVFWNVFKDMYLISHKKPICIKPTIT